MATRGMPKQLKGIFDHLWQDVVWVHYKWDLFLQLYDKREDVELLNRTAPAVFRVWEDVMLDEIVISICRVTDPATTGRKKNLTLDRLGGAIDGSSYSDLKREFKKGLLDLRPVLKFARDHRNRRIAHVDLATRLNSHPEPLSDLNKRRIENALEAIATLMNLVEGYFQNSATVYKLGIPRGEGRTLIYWLKKGYDQRRKPPRRRPA